MTGETPNPLDVLRPIRLVLAQYEREMHELGWTMVDFRASREYDAALAQVEALAEAAQAVTDADQRGAGNWTPEGEAAMRDLTRGLDALRAALAPFVAHKDTNHA